MNKQPSFSASEYAGKMKEKATCRERFLVEMENVVPWKEPVSYTHLDVYKRQAQGVATLLNRGIEKHRLGKRVALRTSATGRIVRIGIIFFSGRISGGNRPGTMIPVIEPVSYTHLDVYKRQMLAASS